MSRGIRRLALAALVSLGMLAVSPGAVSAAPAAGDSVSPMNHRPGCYGTLVEVKHIMKGSTRLGSLNLYWDGYYNCAKVVSSNYTWGKSKFMLVEILSCPKKYKGRTLCPYNEVIAVDDDAGVFKYYAGPASVDGRGLCVKAAGDIIWNGVQYGTATKVGHC